MPLLRECALPNKRASIDNTVTDEKLASMPTSAVADLSYNPRDMELSHSMACAAFAALFASGRKSGEITPACVRWLARDVY